MNTTVGWYAKEGLAITVEHVVHGKVMPYDKQFEEIVSQWSEIIPETIMDALSDYAYNEAKDRIFGH